MNHITVVGILKDPPRAEATKLYATIIVKKQGSGTHADKVFTRYFSVESFGRDQATNLEPGMLVSAHGEADAEAFQSKKDQKWYGRVVIKGWNCIQAVITGIDAQAQAPAPVKPPPAAAQPPPTPPPPEEDDSVPF
jgi:hypothetical protein